MGGPIKQLGFPTAPKLPNGFPKLPTENGGSYDLGGGLEVGSFPGSALFGLEVPRNQRMAKNFAKSSRSNTALFKGYMGH